MVVYVELDEDAADPAIQNSCTAERGNLQVGQHRNRNNNDQTDLLTEQLNGLSHCDISPFVVALGCYPIVLQIARNLDLNSLHDLALTCKRFRANLLQFRIQLVKSTLRCSNEQVDVGPRLADRVQKSQSAWLHDRAGSFRSIAQNETSTGHSLAKGRITSGLVGRCARDMVAECRRCGIIVCRNCSIKPPIRAALSGRHRRLCRTCMKAPLSCHTSYFQDMVEPIPQHLSLGGLTAVRTPSHFTFEAFAKSPCTCPTAVFICYSCGNSKRTSDVTYMRGWSWRSKYSHFAGYGAGIGEGNEGVECGRGPNCLAAKEVEKEIDCDADELAGLKHANEMAERDGHDWGGTSYNAQQIQGIGGVMKTKVKKLVKVGCPVKEYEDERCKNLYLNREVRGVNRGWCSWCDRVIPSKRDEDIESRGSLYHSWTNSSSSSVGSHLEDSTR